MSATRRLKTWTEVQGTTSPVSQTAPTTDATLGLSLDAIGGFRASVFAADGQVLNGAGALLAYVYNADAGAAAKWSRAPQLDVNLSAGNGCVGQQMASGPDTVVAIPRGRLYFAASGVDFDGGSGVSVRVDAWRLVP